MVKSIYERCLEFKKKYPKTIIWRLKKHCDVVQNHLNDDEVCLYAFFCQKDTGITLPFYSTVIVFTNKRMLLGRKKFFGRYYYTSMTPDMLNDFEIRANILFGMVEIDTVKEHFIINCLDKKSLKKIEDALSKYLVDEKIKYMKNNKDSK